MSNFFLFQKNSKGFGDFCVRNVEHNAFGRREIEIAEQGELKGSAVMFRHYLMHRWRDLHTLSNILKEGISNSIERFFQ